MREAGEVVGAIAKAEPSTALILAMQYIQLGSLPKGSAPAPVVATIVNAAIRDGALVNALRVEPDLGILAAAYVLLLAVTGPVLTRYADALAPRLPSRR